MHNRVKFLFDWWYFIKLLYIKDLLVYIILRILLFYKFNNYYKYNLKK